MRAAVTYLQSNPEIGDLRYNVSYGYSRTAPAPHASHMIYRIRFAIPDPIVTVPVHPKIIPTLAYTGGQTKSGRIG